ncbi:hypothetical protein M1M34_gp116 [Haloarcula tailed virus 2]|uniref:Uncharacterized protein n=1 Tax=Haloarcula tailed virus 2 TaxID=2877989 RepID=A0AAE8XZK0_9CAUD|nr:hypothetical protein M1M34_gp116 [Haloarcula tailed virus 2]UBF23217.1 hypothetical protein HATV-2_gp66 [Haloarcula tailed virus 2]
MSGVCEYCNSEFVIRVATEHEGNGTWYQLLHCESCEKSWTDMFETEVIKI